MRKSIDKSRLDMASAESAARLAARDRRRLIYLTIGLVAVVIAFVVSRVQEAKYRSESAEMLPGAPVTERVEVPEIDVARLEARISDSRPADRVLLERDALDQLLGTARNLTPAHFAAMGARVLDGALVDAILADPASVRGQAFTARGWITELTTRRPGGGRPQEVHGRLSLADDRTVYFVADHVPNGIGSTDFVRVDGLLLKAFNDESVDEPGTWVQGPLLVAPEVTPSYPPLGVVEELPVATFLEVADDELPGEVTGIPTLPLWTLMAYARDAGPDAVDWEAAPELDDALMSDMLRDGSSWRIRPFRLPPSKLMGVWVERPGENPARMEEITEGWIGSWNWVMRFALPETRRDLRESQFVTGRGFFLKDFAYEPKTGGLRVAPMVVLDELEQYVPPEDRSIQQIWTGVTITVVALTGVISYLLLRDRRRSKQIYANLVARRRARGLRPPGPSGGGRGDSPAPAPPSTR